MKQLILIILICLFGCNSEYNEKKKQEDEAQKEKELEHIVKVNFNKELAKKFNALLISREEEMPHFTITYQNKMDTFSRMLITDFEVIDIVDIGTQIYFDINTDSPLKFRVFVPSEKWNEMKQKFDYHEEGRELENLKTIQRKCLILISIMNGFKPIFTYNYSEQSNEVIERSYLILAKLENIIRN